MKPISPALTHILQSHSRFVIAAEPSSPQEVTLAKDALRLLLFSAKKQFFSFPDTSTALDQEYRALISSVPQHTLPADVIISLPENSLIDEVTYETESRLSFIITPKEKFDTSRITITEKRPLAEAGFFFFPYDHSFRRTLAEHIDIPAREKIIFFTENRRTYAEKIFDISRAIHAQGPNDACATLLYASLVEETDTFQKNISPETFEVAKTLLEIGARKEVIRSVTEKQKNIADARLLGRALARTHIEEATSSSWTFITEEDFKKTRGAFLKEQEMPQFMKMLRGSITPARVSFLFWENDKQIHAYIYSEDESLLSSFAEQLGKEQGARHVLADGFNTFSEAETKMREIAKRAL